MSLVLDWSDLSLFNPINFVSIWSWTNKAAICVSWRNWTRSTVETFHVCLFLGRVGHQVVFTAYTCSSWVVVMRLDGRVGDLPVGSSTFILGFSWEALSIGGNIIHELEILRGHVSIRIELGDLILLDNLVDNAGSDGRSSDGTTTNLEESSFVLHIKYYI